MEDVIRGDHSEESSALDSDTVSESGSYPDSGSHSGSGSGSVEWKKNLLHLPKKKANFSKIIGTEGGGDFSVENLGLLFQN